MHISWDPAKNRRNVTKHGISFELAGLVFSDPLQITRRDLHEHEERWRTMGLIDGRMIVIVHTASEDKNGEEEIRIISARKATSAEREVYENHR